MLRYWAAKFNKSLSKRSSSRRLEVNVPIKLTVEPDKDTGRLGKPPAGLSITGETVDFSKSGVAFKVSCIRLREFYLVGEGRILSAEVALPNGKVRMRLLGQRYEQTGKHISVTQYVVGAKIVGMPERDEPIYREFLEGKKERGGALKLEVEGS